MVGKNYLYKIEPKLNISIIGVTIQFDKILAGRL